MIRWLIFLFIGFLAQQASATSEAEYHVVRDANRTSSLILQGRMRAHLEQGRHRSNDFLAHLSYMLRVRFYGDFSGIESISLSKEYLSEAFLIKLRKTGTFVGSNFTVKHMGFSDCKDYTGHIYTNCDKLYFYDIQSISQLYRGLPRPFGHPTRIDLNIKDPRVLAYIKHGLPVLGAVQLDMDALFMGMRIKLGADLVPNARY